MTGSSPAHSASADLPVPARPPSETMPISSSISRSSAIRCSADRPRSPNASRSPRTTLTCLSGVTRASADPLGGVQHQPGVARAVHGPRRSRSGRCGRACRPGSAPTSSSAIPVQPDGTMSCARYSSAVRPTAAALTRSGMSLVTSVTSALRGQVQRAGQDARVVAVVAESGRQHRRVGVVELDVQRAALVTDRHRGVQPAVLDAQFVQDPQRSAGRTTRAPGGAACPPAR